MDSQKHHEQGTINFFQIDYLTILIESFLVDRKKLKYFLKFCEDQAVAQVAQLTPDLLRRYIAQTDQDIHRAHIRCSPVDNNL